MADVEKKEGPKAVTPIVKKVVEVAKEVITPQAEKKDGAKKEEKQDGKKQGFGQTVKKMTIQNPAFWLTAGKAVLKLVKAINDGEWYGGDSSVFTYPSALAVRGGNQPLIVGAFARYICDVDKMIDASMFEADTKNIIKSYLISVGRTYTAEEVNQHYDNMVDLMKIDTKALSVVECYLRYNNSRSVPITTGYTLEQVLSSQGRAAIGGNAIDERPDIIPEMRRTILPTQYSSISNDQWSVYYRAKIAQLYSNPRIKGLIEYLYGSFFAGNVTAGVNGNIYVDHSKLERFEGSGTDTMKAAIDQCLQEHEEKMASDVLLDELLTYIGWKQVGTSDHYKRDPLASTYKLNADPEFVAALNNGDLFAHTRYGRMIDQQDKGRFLGSMDRFIMLIPSGDISMSYSKDDLTIQLDLGIIGEYLKFAFMEGHWSDLVLLQNRNGAISIPDASTSAKATRPYIMNIKYAVANASAGTEATNTRLSETHDVVVNRLGVRDWHDYLGIEDTSDYDIEFRVTAPSTAATETNVSLDQIAIPGTTTTAAARWSEPAGSDVVELNNYTQVKQLIRNNFTLGVNFYEQAQVTLRKYAKDAKDR